MNNDEVTTSQRVILIAAWSVMGLAAIIVALVVAWYIGSISYSYIRADGAYVTVQGDVTAISWPDGNGPVCQDCPEPVQGGGLSHTMTIIETIEDP